ncbi:RNA pseudouridylate synthase domain-containing protein 2 [Rhodotorula toruloides]|nr:RNA pseudouridylate synthase domain-containing protein 2 [Rhodotorula toruloides]
MGNPTSTAETRAKAGKVGKGEKGTSRKEIPPPSGAFALPPPKPEYFEENGLRKVKPYMRVVSRWYCDLSYTLWLAGSPSRASRRSDGRAERFSTSTVNSESWIRDRTIEYYQWAIETGVIVVNNQKTTPDYVLRNGDLISNVLHRHEPPVVAGPIRIIYDGRLPGNDGETLVVEKPGSMPVHPTGRYNFNTLLEILKYDYGLPLVHTSNRLDRLTSGVMVCALTAEASKKLGAWFGGRRNHEGGVSKEYVARCLGKLPDGEILCEEPLLTIDRQIGVNVVHPDGRDSKTIFRRMSYDERSNTSVVHCRPLTGRSHQIRVHLQFLGHPIANDPIYQNRAAWGDEGGKGGVFGKDRGGTEEDREERRRRGQRVLAREVERVKEDGEQEAKGGKEGDAAPDPPRPRYNASGDLHSDIARANRSQPDSPANDDIASGSIAAEEALTAGAKRAIAALREVKDEADGFARERDLEAVERARRSERNLMSIDADPDVVSSAAEEDGAAERAGEADGFCSTCFTPLHPDPKPEALFIWLHAMRYKTIDWDWSSKLPYWAEETYEVPLSSILA